MQQRTLTLDEIRQAVAIHTPETLGTYDMLTNKPIVNGSPLELDGEQRLTVFLQMWNRYDPTRPN